MKRAIFVLASLLLAPPVVYAACNIVNGKAYGDCEGVTVNQGSKPALKVRGYESESGIIVGATVFSGGSLYLSGISEGAIDVRRGGRLEVRGIVQGVVRNEGGSVTIEGIIGHLVSDGGRAIVGGIVDGFSGSGPIYFRRGSVLGGVPFEEAETLP